MIIVNRKPEFIQQGDVLFSSRNPHPMGANDPRDTFDIISEYAPDKMVWTYPGQRYAPGGNQSFRQYMQQVLRDVPWFQVSGLPHVLKDQSLYKSASAEHWNGQPLLVAHLSHFGSKPAFGDPFKSDWKELYIAHVFQYIEDFLAVARPGDTFALHQDALAMSLGGGLGGSFGKESISGFSRYLASLPLSTRQAVASETSKPLATISNGNFDYKLYVVSNNGIKENSVTNNLFEDFTKQGIIAFYREVKAHFVGKLSRFNFSMSANIETSPSIRERHQRRISTDYLENSGIFDFAIRELTASVRGDDFLWETEQGLARRFPSAYVKRLRASCTNSGWTLNSSQLRAEKQMIALGYATGNPLVVPWDVYMGGSSSCKSDRYWADNGQFADIYSFAKSNKALMNGAEEISVTSRLWRNDGYVRGTWKNRDYIRLFNRVPMIRLGQRSILNYTVKSTKKTYNLRTISPTGVGNIYISKAQANQLGASGSGRINYIQNSSNGGRYYFNGSHVRGENASLFRVNNVSTIGGLTSFQIDSSSGRGHSLLARPNSPLHFLGTYMEVRAHVKSISGNKITLKGDFSDVIFAGDHVIDVPHNRANANSTHNLATQEITVKHANNSSNILKVVTHRANPTERNNKNFVHLVNFNTTPKTFNLELRALDIFPGAGDFKITKFDMGANKKGEVIYYRTNPYVNNDAVVSTDVDIWSILKLEKIR